MVLQGIQQIYRGLELKNSILILEKPAVLSLENLAERVIFFIILFKAEYFKIWNLMAKSQFDSKFDLCVNPQNVSSGSEY